MKARFFLIFLAALAAGCATVPDGQGGNAGAQGANDVYSDPTYPGAGVHLGIGAGSWGGHSGGGIGFGLGF